MFLLNFSENQVVEKEVEDVDAPKVVDEENVVVENGKSEETETTVAAAVEKPENGSTEADPEVSSTPAEEADTAEEVNNGDGEL